MSDEIQPMATNGDTINPPRKERILKLVIIGQPAVGKTSLRRIFMGEKFRGNYLPTLGADFSLYVMHYNQQKIKTTLWDLSGQIKFKNVHPQYYLGSHGAIVLYDIHSTNPEEELMAWIDTYMNNVGKFVGPVLVIQNKIDLIPEQQEANFTMDHNDLVKKLRIYYENKLDIYSAQTSAKTGENVGSSLENFIKTIADELRKRRSNPISVTHQRSKYTEAAYLMTFENNIGPVIVARSPSSEHMDYSPQEEMSVVKLSAGIDMEQLVVQQYETGMSSWNDPVSVFYYIAFVIENENARGKHDLYILGCNISRDLKNILANNQNMMQGFLTNKMNQFSEFLDSTDYILSDEQDLIRMHQSPKDKRKLTGILEDLRNDIDKIIAEELQG